jgi:hypothetical protein
VRPVSIDQEGQLSSHCASLTAASWPGQRSG